eukprot:6201017-Pleurochrysis_carterae.AAC.1
MRVRISWLRARCICAPARAQLCVFVLRARACMFVHRSGCVRVQSGQRAHVRACERACVRLRAPICNPCVRLCVRSQTAEDAWVCARAWTAAAAQAASS